MAECVNCNLCGESRTKIHYEFGQLKIVECLNCGLIYTNPRLDKTERINLYNQDYFTGKSPSEIGGFDYLGENAMAYTDARLRLKELNRYKKPPGRLLEIGCATGIFLHLARQHNWTVYGVEHSDFAARYARDKLGIEVFIGQLEDASLTPESFDVICMYHLLEHIPDPLNYCRLLFRLLSPKGVLVITVPDISSPNARRLKSVWKPLMPSAHLYHFSKKTLSALLQKTGFSIKQISYYGGTGLVKSEKISSPIKNQLMKHLRYLPDFIVQTGFGLLKTILNIALVRMLKRYDIITVYATKKQ